MCDLKIKLKNIVGFGWCCRCVVYGKDVFIEVMCDEGSEGDVKS